MARYSAANSEAQFLTWPAEGRRTASRATSIDERMPMSLCHRS